MPGETEATKGVSNEVIVDYFYIMFWIVGLTTGLVLILELYGIAVAPKRGLAVLLASAPTLILTFLNAAFLYILSVRALK
jgi:hypothetical protein